MIWLPTFLMRPHGMNVSEAGRLVGFVFGGVSVIGILAGGFLTDRVGAANPVWHTRLLVLASFAGAPAVASLILAPSLTMMFACFSVWAITISFWFGPGYAL